MANMPDHSRPDAPFAWVLRILATTVFLLVWLVVLTFPDFFFFNPWESGDVLRSITLTLTTVGWLLLSTGPLVILMLYAAGRPGAIRWLPIVAMWWPISLLVSHVTVYLQSRQWYVDYLVSFPIFILTDILLPLLLLAAWWFLSPGAVNRAQVSQTTGGSVPAATQG